MGCRLRWLLAVALLCIGIMSVATRTLPSHITQAAVGADSVSLTRLRATVDLLSASPHPIGSREHGRVRQLIIDELRRGGITVSERVGDAASYMAGANHAAHVHNILATIPGRDPEAKSVLLVAHYDSVPNSRGAGDDGAAVSALIETARLIAVETRLYRTVDFLFTDAEELGLLGAQAFVASDPIARRVGLVINFEGRGTSGPLVMYQTSPRSAKLVSEYARSVPYPHTNSLVTELGRVLPNDSDASVFIKAGYPLLALAFVEGFENYHRYSDSSENLESRTLVHCAGQAHALATHFGAQRILPRDDADSVYFDCFSHFLVSYPTWVAALLGTLCAFAWLALARRQIVRDHFTLRGIRRGAKYPLLVMGLGIVLPVMLHLLRSLMSDEFGLIRNAPEYGLADLLLLTALNLLFHARAVRGSAERDLASGSLSVSVVIGCLLGWFMPQASAPWQLFSACGVLVWWFDPAIPERRHSLRLVLQCLPLVVAVLMFAPVIHTAIMSAGPTLMAIPLLLAATVMEYALATLLPKQTRVLAAAAVAGSGGFALMLIAALLPCPKRLDVAVSSLIYGYDSDANKAVYASLQTQSNGWTRQWVPAGAEQGPLTPFSPSLRMWGQRSAPIYPQRVPEISVNKLPSDGGGRRVEVRVSSTLDYRCVALWQTQGQPVQALSVNAQPVTQLIRFSAQLDAAGLQLLSGIREHRVWRFDYCGLPDAPLVLHLRLPPGEGVRVRAVAERPGLPKLMTSVNRQRPQQLIPGIESDITLVAQEITL